MRGALRLLRQLRAEAIAGLENGGEKFGDDRFLFEELDVQQLGEGAEEVFIADNVFPLRRNLEPVSDDGVSIFVEKAQARIPILGHVAGNDLDAACRLALELDGVTYEDDFHGTLRM